MKSWYAVYTHARKEDVARQNLIEQGFDVLLPKYLKRRSHARKVDTVSAPLFPRYIFVSFNAKDVGWRVIRSTRGVIDLVRNGVDPSPVPESVVELVRSREDEDGFVVLGRNLDLKRGAQVRISSGALAGCEAIFEACKDNDRVLALLMMMGREFTVELPIGALAPVN